MNIGIIYKKTPSTPMEFTKEHIRRLEEVDKDIHVYLKETEEELIEACPDAEILFCFGTKTPLKWASNAKSLKWVQSLSAGIDKLEALRELYPNLRISKITGVHGIPMSESAMMYILMFLNQMPFLMNKQKEHAWEKPALPGSSDCQNKILGIVGFGDIGRMVAKKAKFFGMTVYGSKLDNGDEEYLDKIYSVDRNKEMISECDFVLSLLPAMKSTINYFNEDMFSAMKPNSYFISMGRGVCVDEDALVNALKSKRLAGAALDVFSKEPLSKDSPLWDMENVIITPHVSANTPHYFDRSIDLFCDNLRSYLKGEHLLTEICYE